MAEFHLGDMVRVVEPEPQFPIVFRVDTITQGADGKPLYSGEKSEGWWPVARLDYFLTDDQKDAQVFLERLLHDLGSASADANKATKSASFKSMPECWQRWYLNRLAEHLGWKYECQHP